MRLPAPFIGALLSIFCISSGVGTTDGQSPAQRTGALRHYGLDPASSLESRVGETAAAILKMFTEDGQAAPTAHSLTAVERRKVSAAFAALPPLHRRVLAERLRRVSFLIDSDVYRFTAQALGCMKRKHEAHATGTFRASDSVLLAAQLEMERYWEILNLGIPNWLLNVRVALLQLEILELERKALSSGSPSERRLKRLRRDLENVATEGAYELFNFRPLPGFPWVDDQG
jgi:hypothetical protein